MSDNAAIDKGGADSLLPIDDPLIKSLRAGSREFVTPTGHDRPHLDIEVLSNPHVDIPPESGSAAELGRAFVQRYEQLRGPLSDDGPDAVLTRGEFVVQAAPWVRPGDQPEAEAEAVWASALPDLSAGPAVLGAHAGPAHGSDEMAAVFRLDEPGAAAPPLAYVVVLAWFGQVAEGGHAQRSEELVRALTDAPGGLALNTPLHLLCVAPDGKRSDALLRECARLRVSLLLSGTTGRSGDVVTISRAGLLPGEAASAVAVANCPGFKPGMPSSGMARIRFDARRGDAEVAFLADLGSDLEAQPVQVVTSLLSTSRVSNSERRLYRRIDGLIERGKREASGDEERETAIAGLRADAEKRWEDHGYATLGYENGKIPLEVNRHTSYNLLLLLREREGGYDVLLSNHSPLRPSPISDWNTLLLPAFKEVRALLEHLRDDVMRQVQERAEDFERAAHALAFEEAVGRVLDEDTGAGEELWADQMREVASLKIRKVSPTAGVVTEFDYHLVTLLPLIDRATARATEDEEGSGNEAQRRRDRHRIIKWLNGLDTVVPDDEMTGPRDISLGTVEKAGCGVRWDPDSGLDPKGEEGRRKTERLAPGAVWFPLRSDAEGPLWRRCPSIVSRNLDVMNWVEQLLAYEREKGGGRLPSELLLGKHEGKSDSYRVQDGEIHPFDAPQPDDPDDPATSTVAALKRVRFADLSDFAGELAYPKAEFKRVFLKREKFDPTRGDWEGIFVYEADPEAPSDPEAPGCARIGMLRPVQRYVLKAGLERAGEIHEQVRPRIEAEDPWGFARVRKGEAAQAVAVTPPIVELLHPRDREDPDAMDFIVCDGNHRVVQAVWFDKEALPAVAVVGDLPQPYYARPFGRFEWGATAENQLTVTPEPASKYLVRKVEREKLSDEAQKKLAGLPDSLLFRRYYRNLESGFGYMGGQGGRFVAS